ncbi:hypothetical protein [Deinococcus aluminii]|uniref:hypothetical protein n=1 Tax=Deinococcus aluminii TaxID=1656885 RepID=UPI0031F02E45
MRQRQQIHQVKLTPEQRQHLEALTTKDASWLNMIEIEFGVPANQCLDRWIPDQAQLKREVEV